MSKVTDLVYMLYDIIVSEMHFVVLQIFFFFSVHLLGFNELSVS